MNRVTNEEPRSDAVRDLGEAIAVRQEGGTASPDALAQSFLAQMRRDIEIQVDQRVQEQLTHLPRGGRLSEGVIVPLVLGSLGIGIPLSVVAGVFGGFPGILVVWICLVLINMAWSLRR